MRREPNPVAVADQFASRGTAPDGHRPERRNRLLGLLPPADLFLLTAHCKEIALERGKVLQEADAPIDYVYFPYSGMVSLMAVMPDRQAVETATVGAEGAVSLSAGLGSPFAVSRAVVQFSGTAARVPAERLAALAEESAAIRAVIVRYNDALFAQIQQSVACNALHDVEARLCRWLLHARDRLGSDTLPLTQEFLARMLVVRRTTVTLTARALQSAGIIQCRRGLIEIRDAAALEAKACECYRATRRRVERR
jgi:CRP-like cAMP-binding protein